MLSEMFYKLWANGLIQLAVFETIYMTVIATAFSYLFGLPLGMILCVTDVNGIRPTPWVNRILGFVVNFFRSILELLRTINQTMGVTIIVITHEMKVIDQICDRVAVIDNSRIAEEGRVSEVFTNPQSDIARDLILPQDRAALDTAGGRRIRLTFDGLYSQAPIISQMVLDCQAPVNILFADTKEYEGVIYGHMIVELPTDERQADKIIAWLSNSQVGWKEEK